MEIVRTDAKNLDFLALVAHLDAGLRVIDGGDFDFFTQFNQLDSIKHVLVAYEAGEAVGCGAIKHFDTDAMEVKRMFVLPTHRKRGIASAVLQGLENWARELVALRCVLETGELQPEAVALYQKSGYQRIENYGQYAGIEGCLCFEKRL